MEIASIPLRSTPLRGVSRAEAVPDMIPENIIANRKITKIMPKAVSFPQTGESASLSNLPKAL